MQAYTHPHRGENSSDSPSAQSILNKVHDVIWVYSLSQQKYTYISPSVEKLRGFTPEQALKESLQDSLHPDDYIFIANHLPPRIERFEAGDDQLQTLTNEVRQTCSDGTLKWVEIVTTLIKNTQGKVTEIHGVSRDISHRKSETDRQKDTQSFFETVFNYTGTGIVLMHEDGRLINVNKGFCKMLGYPREYVMEKNFYSFLAPGDADCIHEVFGQAKKEKGFENQAEIRLINVQGHIIWGLFTLSGVTSLKNNCVNWVMQIQETTVRKKAEEIIKVLNTDLQLKNKEMEQLVYVTSHDLRSPLVNIKGFSKELHHSLHDFLHILKKYSVKHADRDKFLGIKKDVEESLRFIDISVNKMDKLLGGLLEYSRLGKKMSEPTHISMDELAGEVLKNFEYLIKTNQTQINISPLPPCKAREDMINQAFSNLLGNAIKYLDPQREGIIKISGWQENGFSVYCIEDNGMGIEKTYHQKIFELFYRHMPQAADGEGLGLPMVKKILELNEGHMKLESEKGKGSRFYVYLPAIEKAESQG